MTLQVIYIFFSIIFPFSVVYDLNGHHWQFRENLIKNNVFILLLRWTGHVDRMEEGKSALKILTGTLTGNRLLGRPRCRHEDNILMELKEIGIHTRNLVNFTQDRDYWRTLVNAALNFQVP